MSTELKELGWCLVEDRRITFHLQLGVIGALYTCPFCGTLYERVQESKHVIHPSEPLLERLEKTKE